MKKEARVFLTAVMFLTRIRVPATIDHSPEYLQKAPRYFPMIGWIVGGSSALAWLLFGRLVSPELGVAASMVTSLLITGAFHEDGFADVCDGFGGGWTKEKILIIMKDSRIGAYGAIGLIAILGSKFLLLKELDHRYFIVAILAAHSLSRLMPILVIQGSVYASDPDQSKAKPLANHRLRMSALLFAALTALVPFIFLPLSSLLVIVPALLITYAMSRYFTKWIGGYTGDCLGAIQQVTELVIYLGFVVSWRYL